MSLKYTGLTSGSVLFFLYLTAILEVGGTHLSGYSDGGKCPRGTVGDVTCHQKDVTMCRGDENCKNNEFCCGTACGGKKCEPRQDVQVPRAKEVKGTYDLSPSTSSVVSPALCPRLPNRLPQCLIKGKIECQNDPSCPVIEMCCPTLCGGQKCVRRPIYTNVYCPNVGSDDTQPCPKIRPTFDCHSDVDCSLAQMCCGKRCGGTKCMKRTPPGATCQRVPFVSTLICQTVKVAQECDEEDDCEDSQTCCPTICGGTYCAKPIYPIFLQNEIFFRG